MEDLAGTQKSEKITGSHFACLKLTYFPTKIKRRDSGNNKFIFSKSALFFRQKLRKTPPYKAS